MLVKSHAQQKHFIYVESEDRQAFAVVLNGKVFSSSDYGYVILPKLTDGTYNFTVSFPMNKFPDQKFKCVINKKDVGYKLENNAGKGWVLQNMQTQKFLDGNGESTADNAFSNMLSDVVNDSNLTSKNLPASNIKTNAVADTVANASLTTQVNAVNNKNNSSADSVTQPQKISEAKLDTGTTMTFVDKTTGTDTIHVFIPSDATANSTTQPQSTTAPLNNTSTVTDTVSTALNQSPQTIDTTIQTSANPFYKPENVNTTAATSLQETTVKPAISNAVRQDCSSMISDNDMDKIKRKMFVQNNDNGMVQTALRYVNNKCITTDQVKTLGNLFSSDDGRYNLYDVLYKHVYDYGNYTTLESQIIDPYYKKRFEVMLR